MEEEKENNSIKAKCLQYKWIHFERDGGEEPNKYVRCQAFAYYLFYNSLLDSENVAMTTFAIKALEQYWRGMLFNATQREILVVFIVVCKAYF